MNWRLVSSLSVFGVAMGVASVLGLTKGLEPVMWPIIGIFCAIWIARKARQKYLLHGFFAGLLAGGIAPLIQALLFSTYTANNPRVAEGLKDLPAGFSPQSFFFVLVPIIAVLSGLVLGLLSWVTGKIVRSHA
ncbi:MAG: hypothetical protein ACREBG_00240 [Pyrinomonadaceae bacterium]